MKFLTLNKMKKIVTLIFIVFAFVSITYGQNSGDNAAKVVFYRPRNISQSAIGFTIGSFVPDTVFLRLKNGCYHEVLIRDLREWQFVGGTFAITAFQNINIEAGKTYYIRCYIKFGVPDKGMFELTEENSALQSIKKLKQQKK